MGLYMCEECGCVENTALGNFWIKSLTKDKKALCTECDPSVGRWHGRFPKRPADGMLLADNGMLYSEKPRHVEIVDVVGKSIDVMAWELHCKKSKGGVNASDSWEQLGQKTQQKLRKRVLRKLNGR